MITIETETWSVTKSQWIFQFVKYREVLFPFWIKRNTVQLL